ADLPPAATRLVAVAVVGHLALAVLSARTRCSDERVDRVRAGFGQLVRVHGRHELESAVVSDPRVRNGALRRREPRVKAIPVLVAVPTWRREHDAQELWIEPRVDEPTVREHGQAE